MDADSGCYTVPILVVVDRLFDLISDIKLVNGADGILDSNLSKSYLMHPWNAPSLKKTYASTAPQGTSRKRKNRSKATFRCNLQPNYILFAISRNNCKA